MIGDFSLEVDQVPLMERIPDCLQNCTLSSPTHPSSAGKETYLTYQCLPIHSFNHAASSLGPTSLQESSKDADPPLAALFPS